MRHHRPYALMIVLLLATRLLADDAKPATQPAATVASLTRQVALLANDSYPKREAARVELMGLKRTDLPALRQAVKQNVPLQPSQTIVLRDIVSHVYLAGDDYVAEDDGFLGVKLPSWSKAEERALLSIERGVAIVSRIPGFCAFRMLQDADVVLAIVTDPDGDSKPRELNSPEDLIDNVKAIRAGQTIAFDVLREGKIMRIRITLDRKPIGLGAGSLEEFMNQRADRASELWEKEFAPLLDDKVG